MKINSKDYFNNKINWNKEYLIKVVKTEEDIEEMILFFNKFIKLDKENKFIGLDFEFNSSTEGKKIALFQINLESDESTANIFLFYPPDLKHEFKIILIQLLTNQNIKKILHGAEALDIPYLFKDIFINNELRNSFCNNLFDTRYLCEYYHIDNKLKDKKCKIYSLLREMNVIDDNQLEMLYKNEEDMGPIYLVQIDVRNLDEFTMLYSAFDVLYLPALLLQFPKSNIYENLIPELTCFNYIDRYENIFTKPISELVNRANNYYMKIPSSKGLEYNLKLIDIYSLFYYWINDSKGILKKLLEINYFKKFIDVFIKFIIYKRVIKNYQIWENSTSLTLISRDFEKFEDEFKKLKLTNIFEEFFKNIASKLRKEIDSYN